MSKREKILLMLYTLDYNITSISHFTVPLISTWLQKLKGKKFTQWAPTYKHTLFIHLVFPYYLVQCQTHEHSINITTKLKQTSQCASKLPKVPLYSANDSK